MMAAWHGPIRLSLETSLDMPFIGLQNCDHRHRGGVHWSL